MTTRQKKKLYKKRYHVDRIGKGVNIKRSLDTNYVVTRRILKVFDKAIMRGADGFKECEECKHIGRRWDEEPCDSCTGKDNHYEARGEEK